MYRSYTSKAVVPECKRNLYNVQHKINPWFLTGFLVPPSPPPTGGRGGDLRGPQGTPPPPDGEGCFLISISKKESLKIG